MFTGHGNSTTDGVKCIPKRCDLPNSLDGGAWGIYFLLGLNAISLRTAIPEASLFRGAHATCSFKSMSRKQRALYERRPAAWWSPRLCWTAVHGAALF